MGSLGDYGSEYLDPGEHRVYVSNRSNIQTHSGGKSFIRFYFSNTKTNETFWLTKKAMWRLTKFASAQGWDVDTIPDPLELGSAFPWDIFVNRQYELYIVIEKAEGGFSEITDYYATDTKATKRPWPGTETQPEPVVEPEPAVESEPVATENAPSVGEEDLPF